MRAAPAALREGLRYDLSFYSGGMGVIDRMHVVVPCAPVEVEAVAARLGMLEPAALLAHPDQDVREQVAWLLLDEDQPEQPLSDAVAAFIDGHRAELQPPPGREPRAWVSLDSGVNAWSLVYAVDGELAFIGYDQG